MRKQPYPISDLTGGMNVSKDAVYLIDKMSPHIKGARFSQGILKKDFGWHTFGTGLPLDGIPMLIDTFYLQSGTEHLLVVTTKWVYLYNPTTGVYTKKNTTAFTGNIDNQFCSATTLTAGGADIFILTNGKDPIQKWDGSSNPFSALGGLTNITAEFVIPFMSRLILGNTTEGGTHCPRRIRWSIAGDPETYTGTGSGFVELVNTVDWISSLIGIKSKLFIIKERSIWELVYVGNTTENMYFTLACRLEGVGTYSPGSVVALGEEIVFFGTDNVYTYDTLTLTPIGVNIYPMLYETEKKVVTTTVLNRCPATFIEELNEYWIVVPTSGGYCDLFLKYSFETQSWVLRDKTVSTLGYYSVVSTTGIWAEATGTWAEGSGSWMDKALPSGAPTTLIGTPDGYIYEDDRLTKSTDSMLFETKDFTFQHASRIVEFRIQAKGGPFQVYYSLDQGSTWSKAFQFPVSTEFREHVAFLNLTTQHIRFKVTSIAEDLDIKWIEPWYIPRTRSKSLISH